MIAKLGASTRYLVLLVVAFASIFPLLVALDTIVKPDSDIAGSQRWVPSSFTWKYLRETIAGAQVWHWMASSLLIACGVTVCTLALAIPAAYVLARRQFRGGRTYLDLVLVTQTVAPAVLIVPLFRLFGRIGLLNSYTGVIVVSTAFVLPFAIWLLVAFFRQVPNEIEESAALDGAAGMRFLLRFMIPISMPGITATGVWAFIYGWNEFMFSLTFLSGDSNKWPITIGISSSVGQYSVSWQPLMVTSIIGTIPVLGVFLVFRRQLESGLGSAALS